MYIILEIIYIILNRDNILFVFVCTIQQYCNNDDGHKLITEYLKNTLR